MNGDLEYAHARATAAAKRAASLRAIANADAAHASRTEHEASRCARVAKRAAEAWERSAARANAADEESCAICMEYILLRDSLKAKSEDATP